MSNAKFSTAAGQPRYRRLFAVENEVGGVANGRKRSRGHEVTSRPLHLSDCPLRRTKNGQLDQIGVKLNDKLSLTYSNELTVNLCTYIP